VGPVTASAFVAAVDTPERFDNAHQVEAYFGLVPSERSSGEQQRKGRITKAGNARVRWLLVQVAASQRARAERQRRAADECRRAECHVGVPTP
jgi:transposase